MFFDLKKKLITHLRQEIEHEETEAEIKAEVNRADDKKELSFSLLLVFVFD